MELRKKDLKCLHSFIASGNPKVELDFAYVGNGGIFATDTRKAIKLHDSELDGVDALVHGKLLKGFFSAMCKDDIATIEPTDNVSIECGLMKMALDTATFDFRYIDSNKLLNTQFDYHFKLDSLHDILFELTQKNCFIESSYLNPLIENSEDISIYDIFYTPQDDKSSGIVKIVSTKTNDEESKVFYTALIMGREFKSKAR